MKYLTEERFTVSSHDAEAQKRYADNWERIFGEKPECSCPHLDANESMHDRACPCYKPGVDEIEMRLKLYTTQPGANAVAYIPDDLVLKTGRFAWSHASPCCDNNCSCYEDAEESERYRAISEAIQIGSRCPVCNAIRDVCAIERDEKRFECCHPGDYSNTRRHKIVFK